MARKIFEVTITLRSPFSFPGLDPRAHGFDASSLRDEHDRLIIPGDHLRGHLRHAFLAQPKKAALVEALFGNESAKRDTTSAGEQDKPLRGALLVGDLAGGKPQKSGIHHRVQIDDITGAADDGMLQMIELPLDIGATMTFKGRLVLRPDQSLPKGMEAELRAALQLIPAMGHAKSAGFGEIIAADIKDVTAEEAIAAEFPKGDRLSLTVGFDRPLLVDADRISANVFRGNTIVPGGAIKGALAEALKDADPDMFGKSTMQEALTRLIVGHAFPLKGEYAADRALPLSIATARDDDTQRFVARDLTEMAGFDALTDVGAPTFVTDWKEPVFESARKAAKRPDSELKHLPRGRVRIDPDGTAEEGALFVVEPVETHGRTWRFTLDRNNGDPACFELIQDQLRAGLDGVGRTGARMTVVSAKEANEAKEEAATTLPVPVSLTRGGKAVLLVLLETPAVMLDPDDVEKAEVQYRRYFAHLATEGFPDLTLLDHFAMTSLRGAYQGFRFKAFGQARYQPFEVTMPGAVFVFADTAAARTSLEVLALCGLPALRFERGAYRKLDWAECPFTPENGYGAISIDIDPAEIALAMEQAP
ncbi:MAG: RAMP superfamily CRISPR-associated protein [Bosea sp. (in: a-proteobacteria)]